MKYDQTYLDKLLENKVEESLILEYKSAPSLDRTNQKKVNEISKDVSSFANAAGGIIIYGIEEKGHIPVKIGPLNRSKVNREWLEQKIQDLIKPRIDGIKIFPIEIDSDENQVVYLIEIPQSNTAHQADDKKYYKRHNFNVLAMHDHEIRDVMNRLKHPRIELEFTAEVLTYKTSGTQTLMGHIPGEEKTHTISKLNVYAINKGNVLAQFMNGSIYIPQLLLEGDEWKLTNEKAEFYISNKVRDIIDSELKFSSVKDTYGPARFEPILPKTEIYLDEKLPNLTPKFMLHQNLEIEWIVYADNSNPIKGLTKIKSIKIDYKQL